MKAELIEKLKNIGKNNGYFHNPNMCLIERADLDEVIQAMHDYAGQSDAKHNAIQFLKYIDIYHNDRKDISYNDLYEKYIECYQATFIIDELKLKK